MSIADKMGKAYKVVSNHIGKLIATIGGTLMALDLAGQGDGLKQMADKFLGEKGAQKIGVILFVMAGLRFLYAGWKAQQKQAQIEALQAQVDALAKAHADLKAQMAPPSNGDEPPVLPRAA